MLNGVEIIFISVLLTAGVIGWVVIESAIWFFKYLTILWG